MHMSHQFTEQFSLKYLSSILKSMFQGLQFQNLLLGIISLNSPDAKTSLSKGPHSHILMTGGCPSDFFGSEILATKDFFGSRKKKEGFFGVAKKGLGDFFGYAKKR